MDAFVSTLVGLGIAGTLIAFLAIVITNELRTVKLAVYLRSRKSFEKFDPKAYLYNLSEDDFRKVEAIANEGSKKNRLKVSWRYSTPAGKQHYSDARVFSKAEALDFIDRMKPVFLEGKEQIEGLNALYAHQLLDNEETIDGTPKIYCYSIPQSDHHMGQIKVGYAKNDALKRIEAQFKTAARLKIDYKVHFIMPAVTTTGRHFTDHTVHRILKDAGVPNPEGEWFDCAVETAIKAVRAAQSNQHQIKR